MVGRVNSLLPKPAGFEAARERSIAFVETVTYSGNVRTPLSGVVEQVNNEVIENPSLINSDPYGRGWIARLRPLDLPAERMHLSRSEGVKEAAEKTIQERCLRCFSIYPTYRVSGIG